MSFMEKLAAASNRFYDRMRSDKADDTATAEPTGSVDDLAGHKYCVLVSYRRNGEPIPSPLWFGVHDGRVYFHTGADSMKVRRIRNNPEVRIAPSTQRGRPKGPPFVGKARVMDPSENEDANRWIQANYGLFRKMYEGAIGDSVESVHVEVTPTTPA